MNALRIRSHRCFCVWSSLRIDSLESEINSAMTVLSPAGKISHKAQWCQFSCAQVMPHDVTVSKDSFKMRMHLPAPSCYPAKKDARRMCSAKSLEIGSSQHHCPICLHEHRVQRMGSVCSSDLLAGRKCLLQTLSFRECCS